MGKVKYNKEAKMFERTVKINGVSAILYFPTKEQLEELPYRLNNKLPKFKQTRKIKWYTQ